MSAETYTSIFLEEDWAHQKYFGWELVNDTPGIRILRKRNFFISRFLILLTDGGRRFVARLIDDLIRPGALCEIIIHDFDASESAAQEIAGFRFEPIGQESRILNVATMVIDLSRDETAILADMSASCRNSIRKAQSRGVTIAVHPKPDTDLRKAFGAALGSLAAERRLKFVDTSILSRMYDDGRALLFTAGKGGEINSFAHVYSAGNKAIFMYGVNPTKDNNGVGAYMHWKIMCYLKQAGARWYDLGGVPSFNSSDGIYKFKRAFGSMPVRLGLELVYRSEIVKMLIFVCKRVGN